MIYNNLVNYIQYTPNNFNPTVFKSLFNDYLGNITQFYKNSHLTKISDYFYSINYDAIDYDAGADYCIRFQPNLGDCSSVYKNGIYGRNYDWYYDNSISFLVKTSNKYVRHSSIGIGAIAQLDKFLTEETNWNDFYAALPNLMLDGINDAGVVCNTNVTATGDYGITTGTNPQKESMCILMIVRYILDNADSVDNAIELLHEKNWWAPQSSALNSELHFMIGDATKSCVVEFINNKIEIIENAPAMTNFYLYNVNFNQDGSVYTPATQTDTKNAIITNNVTPYGCGLERYNTIIANLENVEDKQDMIDLMQSLYYTNAYTAEPDESTWYTEMVGVKGLTVISTPEEYAPIFQKTYEQYINRNRNNKETWQTVHMVVYDINELTATIFTQEGTTPYEVNLKDED